MYPGSLALTCLGVIEARNFDTNFTFDFLFVDDKNELPSFMHTGVGNFPWAAGEPNNKLFSNESSLVSDTLRVRWLVDSNLWKNTACNTPDTGYLCRGGCPVTEGSATEPRSQLLFTLIAASAALLLARLVLRQKCQLLASSENADFVE